MFENTRHGVDQEEEKAWQLRRNWSKALSALDRRYSCSGMT
jgi:hypothetical protein